MGEAVDVDAGLGAGLGVRTRFGGDDGRLGQPRGEPRGLGELRGELAEGEVLGLVLDQAVGGDVPEGGGAAVAQDHLVPLGEGEQVAYALADPADQVLDRGLAVGGAQQGGTGGGERVERLRAHLGGASAESTVGGLDVSGNPDLSHGREPSPSADGAAKCPTTETGHPGRGPAPARAGPVPYAGAAGQPWRRTGRSKRSFWVRIGLLRSSESSTARVSPGKRA